MTISSARPNLRPIIVACIVLAAGPLWANQRPCPGFVERSGVHLSCGGNPFYAIGVNSYFLENIAALNDTDRVDEVFREAAGLGTTTLRTWAFFDCPDTSNPACIQWAPGKFNERGLRSLDYVVAKAGEYSIRLVLTLVNNWEEYGGMNQYVAWYAQAHPPPAGAGPAPAQRTIFGESGRFYRTTVAGSLTHDDFYTNPTIRAWYRGYVSAIVHRTNTVTGVEYGEDPAILAWELANEPRSSDPSGDIVAAWVDEMSAYLKSIDAQHLLGVGEEGFDCSPVRYAPPDAYDGQSWFFDGTNGASFSRNSAMPGIDLAGIHMYPEGWHLSMNQALTWLNDHQRIADALDKPLIIGEVGVRSGRSVFYPLLFNEAYTQNTAGLLVWQLVYAGRPDNDGFAFSCPADSALCGLISGSASRFMGKGFGSPPPPSNTLLLPNYPNPFNQLTIVPYELPEQTTVRIELYSSTGRRVAILFEGVEPPGRHLSVVDGTPYASGIYLVRLTGNRGSSARKICLMK
jgi:mannan endo-1,4-beta-mannosidase